MKEFYNANKQGVILTVLVIIITIILIANATIPNYISKSKLENDKIEAFLNKNEDGTFPKRYKKNDKYIVEYKDVELLKNNFSTTSPLIYYNKQFGFGLSLPCYESCLDFFLYKNYYPEDLNISEYNAFIIDNLFILTQDMDSEYFRLIPNNILHNKKISQYIDFYNKLKSNPETLGAKKVELAGKEAYYFENNIDLPGIYNFYLDRISDIYIIPVENNKYISLARAYPKYSGTEKTDSEERKIIGLDIINTLKFDKVERVIDDSKNLIFTNQFNDTYGVNIAPKRYFQDNKYIEEYELAEIIRDSLASTSPTTYHDKQFGFSFSLSCYEYCVGNSIYNYEGYYTSSFDISRAGSLRLSNLYIIIENSEDNITFYKNLQSNPETLGAKKVELAGKEAYYFDPYIYKNAIDIDSRVYVKDIYIIKLGDEKFLRLYKTIPKDGKNNIEILDSKYVNNAELFKIINTLRFDK